MKHYLKNQTMKNMIPLMILRAHSLFSFHMDPPCKGPTNSHYTLVTELPEHGSSRKKETMYHLPTIDFESTWNRGRIGQLQVPLELHRVKQCS